MVFGEMVGKLEKTRPVHLKEPGLNHDSWYFPGLDLPQLPGAIST